MLLTLIDLLDGFRAVSRASKAQERELIEALARGLRAAEQLERSE